MRRARLSIALTDELKQYIEQESEKLGISQGAFVSMCIAQKKQGEKMLESLDGVIRMYEDEKSKGKK